MRSFSCIIKKHVSVVQIIIDKNFLENLGNRIETPFCHFDDIEDVNFTVVCEVTYTTIKPTVFTTNFRVEVKSKAKLMSFFDIEGLNQNSTSIAPGCSKYFQKSEILSLCKNDDNFTLVVTVKYETNILVETVASKFIQFQTHEVFNHIPADVKIIVGDEEVNVHSNFMALLSPVFKTILNCHTENINTKIIRIDFDAIVVKDSINLLYGRCVELKSIPQAIGILQFFKFYQIKNPSSHIESWIVHNVNFESFSVVAKYAFDHCVERLQRRCHQFVHQNPHIVFTKEYRQLPSCVMFSLLDDEKF